MNSVCIVAIAKDELFFIDEWVAYHQIIGVDHIFLYDDEEGAPLEKHFSGSEFVTVVPWAVHRDQSADIKNQIRAYQHASEHHILPFDWVCFLDIDEYLVFRDIDDIKEFLKRFVDADSISLNWHVFGHNGFYDDPSGFVITNLTRRMFAPNKNVKTITRTKAISEVASPHFCKLNNGKRVDANHRKFSDDLYEGKTDRAHINHYQCRSFKRWMRRVTRGDVNFNFENSPPQQLWRLTEEQCLKQFVKTVALNKNEYIDDYMVKFEEQLSIATRALHEKYKL